MWISHRTQDIFVEACFLYSLIVTSWVLEIGQLLHDVDQANNQFVWAMAVVRQDF
jgi:hypothetical protein